MKTCIVTGCDKKYLPGVKAVLNSIKANGNTKADLFVLAHGDPADFEGLTSAVTLFNIDCIKSPKGGEWETEIPAMYSRLMIPRIFSDYDRALWLDADTIVLKDIDRLLEVDLAGHPCAATLPSRSPTYNTLDYQLVNPSDIPESKNIKSLQAGVFLYDVKAWNSLGYNEIVDDLLTSNIEFRFVVQGVMGATVKGNFFTLPVTWNTYSNWLGPIPLDQVNILHYVGGAACSPWSHNMAHRQIWEQYR